VRLRDLVADLQGELQKGVDLAASDLAAERSETRFAVRRVEVDLPVGVAERENGDEGAEAEAAGSLDIRPGEGDGRLTFSFVPGVRDRQDTLQGPEAQEFAGGFDLGDFLETAEATDTTDGPIIPEPTAERPSVRFDPSVPGDLRTGQDLPVEAVEGIGPKRAEALEGMGVRTVAGLAAAGPSEVAAELATTDAQARRLVSRARFMDLGADAQTAEALVGQDVAVEQLPEMDPDSLREQIEDAIANQETPVPDGYEPDPETVARLVERARERRR